MDKKDFVIDFADMGFSFADENVIEEINDTKQQVEEIEERMDRLYTIFVAFLDNLSKDPETETLVWPKRAEKIAEFKETIKLIKEGK